MEKRDQQTRGRDTHDEETRDLVERFEACTLPAEEFDHRAHVRVAWSYLRRRETLDAVRRFAASLRRFAAHHGAHGLYHETITWAFLFLIRERMSPDERPGETWNDFEAAHPELFASPSILGRYYDPETLASERARRIFVMPDRIE